MTDQIAEGKREGRATWPAGVTRALPIVLGYIPIGFAFGVLAQKNGISVLNAVLMSLLVYAGSAQLIAVGLLGAGASPLSVILTTFIVNLRHLLLSAALAPFLTRWSKTRLAAFAFELTDEAFAAHAARFPQEEPDPAETFALNVTAQSAWVLGSGLGALAGQRIPTVEPLGLDYALPALFITLLVLQIKRRVQIGVALITGALAVVLLQAGLNQWATIVATLIGATLGVIGEQWTKTASS